MCVSVRYGGGGGVCVCAGGGGVWRKRLWVNLMVVGVVEKGVF